MSVFLNTARILRYIILKFHLRCNKEVSKDFRGSFLFR